VDRRQYEETLTELVDAIGQEISALQVEIAKTDAFLRRCDEGRLRIRPELQPPDSGVTYPRRRSGR